MTCKDHDKIKSENQDLFELLRLQERAVIVLKDRIKDLEKTNEYLSKRFATYWGAIELRD